MKMENYKIVKEGKNWQVVLCYKKGGFAWEMVEFQSENEEECKRYLKEMQR